jgi:hypothetical protein
MQYQISELNTNPHDPTSLNPLFSSKLYVGGYDQSHLYIQISLKSYKVES